MQLAQTARFRVAAAEVVAAKTFAVSAWRLLKEFLEWPRPYRCCRGHFALDFGTDGGSAVASRLLGKLHARVQAELGVDAGEEGLHGPW